LIFVAYLLDTDLSLFQKVQLYFHTLRYLKPAQVWARWLFWVHRPRLNLRPAPHVRPLIGLWQRPGERQASMLMPTRFRFLNLEKEISSVADWNSPSLSKLWLYNLHYFDDLNAKSSASRKASHRELIARWIVENSPGEGVGWEPYPISLRIVNWIKWALSGNELDDVTRQSLAIQARFLSGRLERHLLGNHFFANAKALLFAGCYFEGHEAEGWLRSGMRILESEIPEQILADGGHFERSTMYHALAFEDMLDLANLFRAYPETLAAWSPLLSSWHGIIFKMGSWLRAMSHPDGEISFFNDAAMGIALSPTSLFDYAARLGLPIEMMNSEVIRLASSGYIRIAMGPAVLLIDVAPVGPDYLPAHAHADTLSYELSLHGHRVVVNSGTSCYGLGRDREWQRSTAAHSTLEIDGENSSEVWAGFRVARRAYPVQVSVKHENAEIIVEASHDGYCRLPKRPVHRRTWILRSDGLLVTDLVEGSINKAVSRVYFHPAIHLEKVGASGTAHWDAHCFNWTAHSGEVSIQSARWYPKFGVDVGNLCIEMSGTCGKAALSLNW
jgi:uncharacterized heparinase superfamily protein